MNLQDLFDQYNLIEGSFEENLNWSHDICFEEAGVFTFQILQIKNVPVDQRQFTPVKLIHQTVSSIVLNLEENVFFHPAVNYLTIYPLYQNNFLDQEIVMHNFIIMISLLPAKLGPIETWEEQLNVLIDRGYNGFHFAPIQKVGVSHSAYCLSDHLELNPLIFGNRTAQEGLSFLSEIFLKLKKKHNVFFLVDIVLNHCAINSQWLLVDINAGFNLQNTPELTAAFQLDSALAQMTIDIEQILGKQEIHDQKDVDKLIHYIENDVFQKLKLEQYFFLDVNKTLQQIQHHLEEKGEGDQFHLFNSYLAFVAQDETDLIYNKIESLGVAPFAATLDISWLVNRLSGIFLTITHAETKKLLEDLNYLRNNQLNSWKRDIINSLKGELEYRFLILQKRKVNQDYRLFTKYFHQINGVPIALNGWIANYDRLEEFVISKDQFYLRRFVVIWEDLVKLNYVKNSPQSNLWNRMRQYCVEMSSVFDGFRLDNFHNTFIPAAQDFLYHSHQKNSNIFIISELFSPDEKLKAQLVEKVGIHRLIEEFQRFLSIESVEWEIYKHQHKGTIWVNFKKNIFNDFIVQQMKNFKCRAIIYDQTHDNPSYFTRKNFKIQLPYMAILSFLDKMLGTCSGFDELVIDSYGVCELSKYPKIESNRQEVKNQKQSKLFFVREKDLGVDGVKSVQLRGNWSNWCIPIEMERTGKTWWARVELEVGEYQYKYIVNGSNWMVDKDEEKSQDGLNNLVRVRDQKIFKDENLIEVRKFFNYLHSEKIKKKETSFRIGDFIIMERFDDLCIQGTMLIARINYKSDGQATLDVDLTGNISGSAKIFYFENHHKIQWTDDVQRIKATLIEQNDHQEFASFKNEGEHQKLYLRGVPENFVMVFNFEMSKNNEQTIRKLDQVFNSQKS